MIKIDRVKQEVRDRDLKRKRFVLCIGYAHRFHLDRDEALSLYFQLKRLFR